jgi:predicted amidophosphoribosyltransferase
MSSLLRRARDSRQVGVDRRERATQAAQAFYVAGKLPVRPIMLVDDVCTTGATLNAAAALLRAAGAATEVHAVVCAWRPPASAL